MSAIKTEPLTPARLKTARGEMGKRVAGIRGPFVGSASFTVLVVGVCLALLFVMNGNFNDSILVLSLCFAITVVGMVLQVGHSNQLAFHQAFFIMFGVYAVGVLNTKYQVSVILAILVVTVASAVIGALVGSVVTRVPGFALALTTLFFSVIASGYVVYNAYLGQATGITGIGSIWSGSSYVSTLERSGAIVVLLLGLSVYVCARIMRSGIGLELSLVGENEQMAASLGINTRRRKLEVFVLSAALAALGGGVFAGTQSLVSPGNFTQTTELTLLIMLFIGGRLTLTGGLIGTFLINYLQEGNTFISSHILIIEGVLFTLILLYAPEGLVGVAQRAFRFLRRHPAEARPRAVGQAGGPALGTEPITTPSLDTEAIEEMTGAPEANGDRAPTPSVLHTRPIVAEAATAVDGGVGAAGDGLALECRGITKRFGGVVAVDDVSLAIGRLGVHALCGPNGAGKTTLFEVVCGGIRPDVGETFIQGRDVSHMPAFERAQLGVARTLQAVRLMNSRSALDNVAVAAVPSHRTFLTHALVKSDLAVAYERAWEALEELGLGPVAQQRVGDLTLESQRMVELARALVTRPDILLLDEPASGLSSEQRARLAGRLAKLGESMTVFLVEHDLQMVTDIAEEIFVLLDGRVVFTGNAQAFTTSDVVRRELMGLLANDALETAGQ